MCRHEEPQSFLLTLQSLARVPDVNSCQTNYGMSYMGPEMDKFLNYFLK